MAPDVRTLLEDPTLTEQLPREVLPALLVQIASEQARLTALAVALTGRLVLQVPDGDGHGHRDDLLDVREAARLLNMSPDWLYKNAQRLPFTRRIGGRSLRFSREGICRYLASRRPT